MVCATLYIRTTILKAFRPKAYLLPLISAHAYKTIHVHRVDIKGRENPPQKNWGVGGIMVGGGGKDPFLLHFSCTQYPQKKIWEGVRSAQWVRSP
jgi:hypothetical protein